MKRTSVPPTHSHSVAPTTIAAAPPATSSTSRITARRAISLLCRIIRHICGLTRDEFNAEMLRRCKTNEEMQTQPHEEENNSSATVTTNRCLLRALHHVLLIDTLAPYSAASTQQQHQQFASSSSKCASFPPTLLHSIYSSHTEADISSFVLHRLHSLGFHAFRSYTPTTHSFVATASPRLLLLALASVISSTRLIDRYLAQVAQEAKEAWWCDVKKEAVVLPRGMRPHLEENEQQHQHRPSSSSYAHQTPLFPQPLLPPSIWDSAAVHTSHQPDGGSAGLWLDQSQEWRLLEQMRREEEWRDEEGASSERSLPKRPSSASCRSSQLNQHPMCLPRPTSSSLIAEHDSLAASLSSSSKSSSQPPHTTTSLHTRLQHRIHQAISTHGRITSSLQQMRDLSHEQTQLLLQLQQIQKHSTLRGSKAEPMTPFELQMIQAPALLSNMRVAQEKWLDAVTEVDQQTAAIPSSTSADEFSQLIAMWWRWMESVAQVEKQQQQADAEEEGQTHQRKGTALVNPASTRIHGRDHRTSGADTARSLGRSRNTTSSPSLNTSRRTRDATNAATSPPSALHPTRALYSTLSYDFPSSTPSSSSSSHSSPFSILSSHLTTSLIGRYHEEQDDPPSDSTEAAEEQASAIVWSEENDTMAHILQEQQDNLARLRASHYAFVESALEASSSTRITATRFPFTVLT